MFVGRSAEVAELKEAMATAPSLTLVEGDAGVGKTRLVSEALDELAGPADPRVLIGRCYPVREPFWLGPVVDALRSLRDQVPVNDPSPVTGALRTLLPELDAWLAPSLEPVTDPRAERSRLFRGLYELMAGLGPVVCVLEDLHWADRTTLEFLSYLAGHPPASLTMIVTYRRSDLCDLTVPGLTARFPPRVATHSIALRPLTAMEVGELAGAWLEVDDVPDTFVSHLHRQTGGVPFVVLEALRTLREREGRPFTVGQLERLRPSARLRDSLLERLGSLPSEARRIVEAAAVLEVTSSQDVLTDVADVAASQATAAISHALASTLLSEADPDGYVPSHGLAARAVRDALPRPRLRQLHLRAARSLEDSEEPRPLARIARHLEQGGDVRGWIAYATAAAEEARRRGDDLAAVELARDALGSANLSRPARLRLSLILGEAAYTGLVPDEAIDVLETLVNADSLPTPLRGRLRSVWARLLDQTGQSSRARTEMIAAVEELEDPQAEILASLYLAGPWSLHGELEEHLGWLQRAARTAERLDDAHLLAAVGWLRATLLVVAGDPDGLQVVADLQGRERQQSIGTVEVASRAHLALAMVHVGHYRSARRLLDTLARSDGFSQRRWDPYLRVVRLLLDRATGRWDGLEDEARDLAGRTPDAPRSVVAIGSRRVLGSLLLAKGELEEAKELLQTVRDDALAVGSVPGLVGATSGLSRLELVADNTGAARDLATAAMAAVRGKGIWTCSGEVLPVAIEALLACGQEDEAAHLLEAAGRHLEGVAAPAAHAALASCRGLVARSAGDLEAAAEHLATARDRWAQLPRPYEAAQDRERHAMCLLNLGGEDEQDRGAEELIAAFKAFEEQDAAWDAARVRAAIRDHSVPLPYPWRGGRRSYGQQLSPRERQVAEMAGRGMTNREIGQALFISHRTVEDHVASAKDKLGVSTREELSIATPQEQED